MKRSQFISAVYGLVNVPETRQNVDIGIAWAAAEDSRAVNNPLDTEEDAPGATDYNAAGVKNFPSWTEGVDATVETLTNGDYEGVLIALRNNDNSVTDKLNAINSSPWGTTISMADYIAVVGNREAYDTEVAGSPADTPEAPEDIIDRNEPKFKNNPVLKVGSAGRGVETVTTILNHFHALTDPANPMSVVAIGGEYTAEVEAAVKDYQTKMGITVDGIVGPETWSSFIYE